MGYMVLLITCMCERGPSAFPPCTEQQQQEGEQLQQRVTAPCKQPGGPTPAVHQRSAPSTAETAQHRQAASPAPPGGTGPRGGVQLAASTEADRGQVSSSRSQAIFGPIPVMRVNAAAVVARSHPPPATARACTAAGAEDEEAGAQPRGLSKVKSIGQSGASRAAVAPDVRVASAGDQHEVVGPGHAVLYLPLAVRQPSVGGGHTDRPHTDAPNFKTFRKRLAGSAEGVIAPATSKPPWPLITSNSLAANAAGGDVAATEQLLRCVTPPVLLPRNPDLEQMNSSVIKCNTDWCPVVAFTLPSGRRSNGWPAPSTTRTKALGPSCEGPRGSGGEEDEAEHSWDMQVHRMRRGSPGSFYFALAECRYSGLELDSAVLDLRVVPVCESKYVTRLRM